MKIGDVLKGKITGIENYGFFISFPNGYTGLVHISEMSSHFVKDVKDYAELNEDVYAKIIAIDDDNNKYKLSIKDINYRTDGREKEKDGFAILKENLPKWIEEYKDNN